MILSSTTIRLPKETMDTLGSIITSEHPALIQTHNTVDKNHSSISSDLRTRGNCSVYRESLKLHSLYNCTPLMNSNTDAKF